MLAAGFEVSIYIVLVAEKIANDGIDVGERKSGELLSDLFCRGTAAESDDDAVQRDPSPTDAHHAFGIHLQRRRVVSYFDGHIDSTSHYTTAVEVRSPTMNRQRAAPSLTVSRGDSRGDARRERLSKFLARFSIRHSDPTLCKTWASTRHQAFLAGNPVDVADAWVTATAVHLDAPLVSHNRRPFENIEGLVLISVR